LRAVLERMPLAVQASIHSAGDMMQGQYIAAVRRLSDWL
jgi:hypothetical protein